MSVVAAEPATSGRTTIELQGQPLQVAVSGQGRDILFLSSGLWFAPDDGFASTLGTMGRVTAPVHPGYAGGSIAPHITSADDLAYLYLDLIANTMAGTAAGNGTVIVAGSFGAFVAAQMAIKSCERIAALVLIGPVGVKAGGRSDRDIVDVFAHPDAELVGRAFAEPAGYQVNPREVAEDVVRARVEAREALARFAWQPYMHDPKLPARLHRVRVPTLILRGAQDRFVAHACAELYANRIAGARLEVIENAGHLPHLERPDATLAAIGRFLDGLPAEE